MLINSPFELGGQTMKNRLSLAPLTRARCTNNDRLPNALMGKYYEQRSGAGLVITEATAISPQGFGWWNAPGAYTDEQMAGWKKIVNRVHAKKSLIYLQLWHMGRQSHSSYHESKEIVSASAIAIPSGEVTTNDGSKTPYETPRALRTDEMAGVVEQYRACAERCKKAGFDGVEIHGANGYLIDQFLQSCSNKRTDRYGGSVENRCRLLLEVVEAIKTVYPANRIGVRISPNGAFGGMGSPDNDEIFPYVASKLNEHGLAYLHVMDGLGFGFHNKCKAVTCADIRKVFSGPIMANVGLTRDIAEGMIRSGACDLACFGRLYISNPDLAERFKNNWPVAPPAEYPTWWQPTAEKGYTDWPFHQGNESAPAQEAKKADNKQGAGKPVDKVRQKLLEKVEKEGGKKAQDIAGMRDMGGVSYFHVAIDSCDADFELLEVCMKAFNTPCDETAEERRGGADAIGKCLMSYNDNGLACYMHVPKNLQECSIDEWWDAMCAGYKVEKVGESTPEYIKGYLKADPDNNVYPIKVRDELINNGYKHLAAKKLVMPDDEGEEICMGDDDFYI